MWCWRILRHRKLLIQKKLADKLVDEKSENIDGKEMVYNENLNDYGNAWNPCTWNSYLLF